MQDLTNGSVEETETGQMNLLDMLVRVGPLIQKAIIMDCTFAVADREKFLLHLSAEEIYLGELEGKPISAKGALYEAIHSGKFTISI